MNQKTKYITGIVLSVLVICALTIPAFALTESDVQSQVSASGKEGVAGNLFVWFLCAVAFLKISQKIDSFMQGLGINVGHTGGSMLAEAMLAARSIAAARGVAGRGRGGNVGRAGSTGGSGGDSNTFLQGGLAGVANRSFYNGAYRNATGTGSGGVGGMAFRASMTKGGDIANNVISRIATGRSGTGNVMSGNMAADALMSYMGYTALGEGAADKCCTAAACKYAVEESAGNGPVGGAKWKSEMCCLLLAPLQNSRRNTICPKKHPKDMIHA